MFNAKQTIDLLLNSLSLFSISAHIAEDSICVHRIESKYISRLTLLLSNICFPFKDIYEFNIFNIYMKIFRLFVAEFIGPLLLP